MIEIKNLWVRLGEFAAIRSVSLSINPGDRIGVVGESGCGKSMLALSIMGMVPDALSVEGSIRFNGKELSGASESEWRRHRARTMAMIFQEPMTALNPLRRIGDIIMEPLMVHQGLGKAEARTRTIALFNETGIPDPELRLRQYPHQLSGGQRQRVLIALALTCNPSLLIADEPTTALDANVALRIIDLLVGLSKERNMALLFISHDLAAVSRATEDIVVMYGGDFVEQGKTREVLHHPSHPYAQGLIAARPNIEQAPGKRQRLPTIPGTVPPLTGLPGGCRFSGRCSLEISICAQTRPSIVTTLGGGNAACHHLVDGEVVPTSKSAGKNAGHGDE